MLCRWSVAVGRHGLGFANHASSVPQHEPSNQIHAIMILALLRPTYNTVYYIVPTNECLMEQLENHVRSVSDGRFLSRFPISAINVLSSQR